MIDAAEFKPFKVPAYSDSQRVELRRAARLHADTNRSDPFAYGRAMLHMTRGIELPSEILSEANRRLTGGQTPTDS